MPNELRNYIVVQEIQQSKVRHEIELEKIDVLTNYYNGKIQEGVKQLNGGDTNLKIDQGASFSSDVTVTNSDGDVTDLTGYTTEAKMAKSYGASDSVTITSALVSDPTTVLLN